MDDRTLFAMAILFIFISVAIKTMTPPGETLDPHTVSIPAFADNYEIKTTIVNGETATIYYTSYSPTRGTYITIIAHKPYVISSKTVYWFSNGTWYYITGAIVESTSTYQPAGILTFNMTLKNNILVLITNGKTYTPTGTFQKTISIFTVIDKNTTIEYTVHHGKFVPLR